MTVRELIEQLTELDPDLHVFVAGYEGGFHYAKMSNVKDIYLNVNPEWFYGPHDTRDNCRQDPAEYKHVKGIIL